MIMEPEDFFDFDNEYERPDDYNVWEENQILLDREWDVEPVDYSGWD
jgi:hypothetical protein